MCRCFSTQTSGLWHMVGVRVCCMHVWSHAHTFTVCMQCMTLTWNCSIPAMMLWIDMPLLIAVCSVSPSPIWQTNDTVNCRLPVDYPSNYDKRKCRLFSCLYHKCCLCGLSAGSPSPQCVLPLSGHLTAASSGGLNCSVLL